MKRSIREIDNGEVEKLAMANCALMLLSRVDSKTGRPPAGLAFKCKTCNRQFSSFQALGGHTASHKRQKLMTGDLLNQLAQAAAKRKKHECSKCGHGFGTGQALGGHMRPPRAALISADQGGLEGNSGNMISYLAKLVPVLKKSSSSKRVMCLDLNLMPYENDLKLGW